MQEEAKIWVKLGSMNMSFLVFEKVPELHQGSKIKLHY